MRRMLRRDARPWWCMACLSDVREPLCPGCGYGPHDARARCVACGGVSRLSARACPGCGAPLRARGPAPAFPVASALPSTVVVTGILLEDRTPASPAPAEGSAFAPVPRQLPWFDVLGLVMLLGSLASLLWLGLGWPGWAVLLLFLAPVIALGLLRRFRPQGFERLRGRAGPLLEAIARRQPEIRRIVVQGPDGRPAGVELAHPSSWPPTRGWPPDGPLRIRCEGAWVHEGRLLRAERVTVVDERDEPLGPQIRARAWQTFPVALGLTTLVLLVMAAIRAIG